MMFKISKARNRKGFTLIELMIVIAIIIILAAIAIPNYLRMTERARKAAVESDLKSLATSLEMYNTDWAEYPGGDLGTVPKGSWTVMKAELTGTGSPTINLSTRTNVLGEKGGVEYMKPAVIDAIVAKSDKVATTDYLYATAASPDGFLVTVVATIGGVVTTFTVTAGGIIKISP